MKTYCEFTFEAAHSVHPYSELHGHTFIAKLTFGGPVDEVYNWPVNLYDVENYIDELKGKHGTGLDHTNLDLKQNEIGLASLENITIYIWRKVKERFPNLEEVELKRGMTGSTEGCVYRGEDLKAADLAA
ncbi:6-pyruvoyl trahydropterin synthase family protein [Microvirga guangxiensis]|uniref:6-carboxy-5,6,7,8-tetrahydropterin synthase n=1 Tax=Microvirga guangxiensis TaxID=549386 RepID=A0A1G5GEH5_9HYPH|nr:6-carboxytetrahydropterin synthase [Microvirga guangxiensis]SCY49924.1 6-pyruvoyl-tetrahydropterin synthase [Microvirga guangxiensis]